MAKSNLTIEERRALPALLYTSLGMLAIALLIVPLGITAFEPNPHKWYYICLIVTMVIFGGLGCVGLMAFATNISPDDPKIYKTKPPSK